jgi:hypothetical protein
VENATGEVNQTGLDRPGSPAGAALFAVPDRPTESLLKALAGDHVRDSVDSVSPPLVRDARKIGDDGIDIALR